MRKLKIAVLSVGPIIMAASAVRPAFKVFLYYSAPIGFSSNITNSVCSSPRAVSANGSFDINYTCDEGGITGGLVVAGGYSMLHHPTVKSER